MTNTIIFAGSGYKLNKKFTTTILINSWQIQQEHNLAR